MPDHLSAQPPVGLIAHVERLAPGSSPTPPSRDAVACCVLTAVETDAAWRLTLWDDPGAARFQAARSPGGRLFEVSDVTDLDRDSHAVAALVEFDGPRTPAQVAADRFASRQRVAPAAAEVHGTGGAIRLRGKDGSVVVVALAESVAVLEAASRAILSTPLLPGEDPELLGGPDRWTACRVDGGAALTAALATAAAGHPATAGRAS